MGGSGVGYGAWRRWFGFCFGFGFGEKRLLFLIAGGYCLLRFLLWGLEKEEEEGGEEDGFNQHFFDGGGLEMLFCETHGKMCHCSFGSFCRVWIFWKMPFSSRLWGWAIQCQTSKGDEQTAHTCSGGKRQDHKRLREKRT